MKTDTIWTDTPPPPEGLRPEDTRPADGTRSAGEARRRSRRTTVAVLVSLLILASLAVGLVLFIGAQASAVGGCGGG